MSRETVLERCATRIYRTSFNLIPLTRPAHSRVPRVPSGNLSQQLLRSSPSSVRGIHLPSPLPVPLPPRQTERKWVNESRSLKLSSTSIHSIELKHAHDVTVTTSVI